MSGAAGREAGPAPRGLVVFDISMSVDGYIVAPGQGPGSPLGEGGERLHTWAFGGDELTDDLMRRARAGLGVVITGRTSYEHAVGWWGADGPTGRARKPTVVLTHRAPERVPENSVYAFVSGGPERALELARAAAGDADISVMGGAEVGREFLAAGLVDEISLHIGPYLFGGGLRLFDVLPVRAELTLLDCLATDAAVHLRYRVDRPAAPSPG